MLLLPEESGSYIRSLPLVVSLSLFGSLIVATSVTPNLATRMLRRNPKRAREPYTETRVAKLYTAFMGRVLKGRVLVVLFAVALVTMRRRQPCAYNWVESHEAGLRSQRSTKPGRRM
jgi:multidrug efflux pump subunit AcrB